MCEPPDTRLHNTPLNSPTQKWPVRRLKARVACALTPFSALAQALARDLGYRAAVGGLARNRNVRMDKNGTAGPLFPNDRRNARLWAALGCRSGTLVKNLI